MTRIYTWKTNLKTAEEHVKHVNVCWTLVNVLCWIGCWLGENIKYQCQNHACLSRYIRCHSNWASINFCEIYLTFWCQNTQNNGISPTIKPMVLCRSGVFVVGFTLFWVFWHHKIEEIFSIFLCTDDAISKNAWLCRFKTVSDGPYFQGCLHIFHSLNFPA